MFNEYRGLNYKFNVSIWSLFIMIHIYLMLVMVLYILFNKYEPNILGDINPQEYFNIMFMVSKVTIFYFIYLVIEPFGYNLIVYIKKKIKKDDDK